MQHAELARRQSVLIGKQRAAVGHRGLSGQHQQQHGRRTFVLPEHRRERDLCHGLVVGCAAAPQLAAALHKGVKQGGLKGIALRFVGGHNMAVNTSQRRPLRKPGVTRHVGVQEQAVVAQQQQGQGQRFGHGRNPRQHARRCGKVGDLPRWRG